MIVYRFIHRKGLPPQNEEQLDYYHQHGNDIRGTEYSSPIRLFKLANGSITIEFYAPVTAAYKLILEVLQNYLPHKSANITITTSLGNINYVFIEPTELQPNYVGHHIPNGEIYHRVSEVVKKYYPNYQYWQFGNGFLVRPLGFIKMEYWNFMLSEIIAIYQHQYEIWVSFAANHGVVVSIAKKYNSL
jgi:hypothetical protein